MDLYLNLFLLYIKTSYQDVTISPDHHTLRLHLISVHNPKTIACLHKGCNKVFSTDALMKSHYW